MHDTGRGFPIFVVASDSRVYTFYNLEVHDFIWHLKACIQDALGTSGLNQELVFVDKQLSDRKWRPHAPCCEGLNGMLT